MDEFVEQFLIEARELVEQATAALGALERGGDTPHDFDRLFRAVHTLKGAAGIVEFDAMGRALHAVEDVLSRLRTSPEAMPPTLVGDGYASIDQVTRWLDEMQASGEPPKNADAAADAIIRRFDRRSPGSDAPPSPVADPWLDRLRKVHPVQFADSVCAFLYRPAENAFFAGEDPLAVAAAAPRMKTLDLWLANDVAFDEFDPFGCALQIGVLSGAPSSEVWHFFRDRIDRVEIVELNGPASGALSPPARALLDAQLKLLAFDAPHGVEGRVAAAGKVAVNVLRIAGLQETASAVETALAAPSVDRRREGVMGLIRDAIAQRDAPTVQSEQSPQAGVAATRSLRVDMDRIDALVNLTGELTVVKNAIGHIMGLSRDQADANTIRADLRKQHDLLQRLVQQLQRAVLQVRVLPLRHVFQRFPRLVREISATLGKPVTFAMEGEAVEADATVVESLFEPLLHLLRNAIGHGVEDAADRAVAGKPATARITLRAHRQLENVVVEIEDDGKGIDIDRVRLTAATRQLASMDELGRMTEADVVALIFAPGFSTATEVTGLSGRGVGMDAVKTAVERIGGAVTVETRAGRGTTFRLVLPFSVMMTRVMTAEVSGQVFGVPLDAVVETASVARNAISEIGAGRAIVLRNRTLPVLDLAAELGLPAGSKTASEARMIVIANGDQLGAVEVDRLGERMDVMLKPLEGLLQGMTGVAGTTLLGDGRVLLVLDVQGLFA
jgi:two-component system chemotaxis sensor kinase CheA